MTDPRLGDFEFNVMAALLHLEGESYGVRVRALMEEHLEREVSMGAVYATLGRLEKKGLLTSRLGDPTPERGGKAKRFFRIGVAGRSAFQRSMTERQRMVRGLDLGAAG